MISKTKNLNIVILFGGRSVEHEISIISAKTVFEYIDKEKYNITLIYVDKEGIFHKINSLSDLNIKEFLKSKVLSLNFFEELSKEIKKKGEFNTVIIPVFHGIEGEGGYYQGLFELLRIPYTSSNVMASSLGMDKVYQKMILEDNNVNIPDWLYFLDHEWKDDVKRAKIIQSIEEKFKSNIFIKPSSLGSSIGITRIQKSSNGKFITDLKKAVDTALQYDNKVIVEEEVSNLVEVNCALFGGEEVITSSLEEIVLKSDEKFQDFETKYIKEGTITKAQRSNTKQSSINRFIPPLTVDKNIQDEIKNTAIKIFKLFNLWGVVRVDFLFDSGQSKVYLSEVNTIPGLLSSYLWEASNIPFKFVIDNVINLSLKRANSQKELTISYDIDILKITKGEKVKE